MSGGQNLQWYASQSALTDPGKLARLLDDLPAGIDELRAVAHGLVIHYRDDQRAYIEELLPDILEGRIDPGRVLDRTVGLDRVPDGYRAMAERESIRVMVRP
jgi:hypothetical protein